MKDRIFLFPDSLPDELHVSQTGRLHRDSGNLATLQTFRDTYGVAPFRLTQWIPTNLEVFAAKLPGDPTQNVANLLRNNTLYPLFETFGNARFTPASHGKPLREQISNMPKRVVGESGETHLCVECLRQDLQDHGIPYIHRSHQIPGVSICWRHGTRLLSACPFCSCPFEPRADLVLAPWAPCPACQQYLPETLFYTPANGTDLESEYARFTHELLISAPGPLSTDALAFVYTKRAREEGFSRGKTIDRIAMRKAIEEHYGMEFLCRVDTAIRAQKDAQWARCLARSGLPDTPLPRHLLLTNFLFKDAATFLNAVGQLTGEFQVNPSRETSCSESPVRQPSAEALSSSAATEQPATLPGPVSALSRAMTKILTFLAKAPNASIADLWKNHHGAMKYIAKTHVINDAWLNSMRSTTNTAATVPQFAPPGSPNDLAFAKHVAVAALAEYSSAKKPTRVTRNFLLRQVGWNPPNTVDPHKYPLTDTQLQFGTESDWHYYARRIVWAILTVRQQSCAAWRVIEPSGVEHHRGKLLVEFFSNLSPTRTLRSGTIADILIEYGIDKQWCGPDPEREFYPRGRSYVRRESAESAR